MNDLNQLVFYFVDLSKIKKPKTIYFLDKNVLQLIQTLQEGEKKIEKTNEIEMQKKLKRIDKSTNIISLMLSIIEGRKGYKESKEEKEQAISEEVSILNGFFKKAGTDINFFLKNTEEFSKVLSEDHVEIDQSIYIEYLDYFFVLWADHQENNNIPKNIRDKCIDKLIEKAKELDLQLQHIVILFTLGAVEGQSVAIQILKPKAAKSYNAYSDIAVLTRVGSHIARFKSSHNCKFLTLDKGLLGAFKILKIRGASLTRNSDGGETASLDIGVDMNFISKKTRKKINTC